MTIFSRPFHRTTIAGLAALAAALFAAPATAQVTSDASARGANCAAPVDLVRLAFPLRQLASRLKKNQPVTIVAIGSSSTAGAGASSPDASYPNRLQVELRRAFPQSDVKVVNRGVNGEEAREMLARLDHQVIAEKPDLILWQVGTNAVLRDHPLKPAASLIHEGLERLRVTGADVVLIDPQFAPKVLAKTDIDDMVDLLETTGKTRNINVFHRFAVMRHWRQNARIPYEIFLSPDELHMNDWSYACFAKLLASAIAEAAQRPVVTVSAGATVQ